jgi:hypothetical protein
MNEKTILLEPLYFAPISYYVLIAKQENIAFDISQNYQKKTFKNRTYILGANGVLRLSIPLQHQHNERNKYQNIKISYAEKWQKDHWNSIISAYRRSPFFEYYEDELKVFYETEYEFLYQWNIATYNWISEKIKLNKIDFINNNANNYISDLSKITDINLQTYIQVFSDRFEFQNNLSILDLLFNVGGKEVFNYLNHHK